MSKKKILFAYNAMCIGGSTTSLLSILNRLDYSKYDVDLLLNMNFGELLDMIPKSVNLLPPALKYTDRKVEYIHRLLSPRFMWHFMKSRRIARKSGVPIHAAQYRDWKDIEFHRQIDKEYDVAIAFLEGDRCKFVARHIKAHRKLAWVHTNLKDGKYDSKYDRDTMCVFDRVVLVSDDCMRDFDEMFPEIKDRTLVVENILVSEYIRSRAETGEPFSVDDSKLNLITVCRISFSSKGLDRAVEAMARLKSDGMTENLKWYIIGDGRDMQSLREMIKAAGLEDNIIILGMQKNPYPFLKPMSAFFLPSRFEGKPMAVTEAFMMGLPVLATEYSSAHEQIRHGLDGYITENSTDGIYAGLKYIIENTDKLSEWKNNVMKTDYSNLVEIRKVEALIDGEL